MTILGFDTSTAASSAAVLRADGELFEVLPPAARLAERPAHAAELLPAIGRVMEDADVAFSDLDAIAVGLGPGTFTGLRIGVATARALAKANDLPVRPVSSLAALAAGHHRRGEASADRREARRGLCRLVRGRQGACGRRPRSASTRCSSACARRLQPRWRPAMARYDFATNSKPPAWRWRPRTPRFTS